MDSLTPKNMDSQEISKIYKTHSPVPPITVLNRKFTWIFEVTQTLTSENTNSVRISKIHKTESSVPLKPEVDLDYRAHSNIVAQ